MKAPALLHVGALLLWAQASGQWSLALLLAASVLLPALSGLRLELDDKALTRATDLATLFSAGALVYFLVSSRMPAALYAAFSWLPVTTLPLLMATLYSRQPLRHRHVFYTLRHSRGQLAQRPLDFTAIHFALCLVSAGVVAHELRTYYPPLFALLFAWLLLGLPSRRPRQLIPFLALATVAALLGYSGAAGLRSAHEWAQSWFIDQLSAHNDDPYRSQTRIGDVGQVKLSETILWRVERPLPSPLPLLLRDGVFSYFDGQSWYARRDSFSTARPLASGAGGATLRMSGSRRSQSVLLAVPQGTVAIENITQGVERNDYGVFRLSNPPDWLQLRLRYPLGGDADTTAPAPGDSQVRSEQAALFTRIPEIQALQRASPSERLQGVQRFFADHFSYTLELEQGGNRRSLERFLLNDRAGHCEYFATATVLMLRHLGIPARYVTGYSLQEYSRLEKRFLIRARHAHAWAEAWVDGHWQEVDTTPANWLAREEQASPWWQPALDLGSWLWASFTEWRLGLSNRDATRIGLVLVVLALLYLGWRLRKAFRRAPGATPSAVPDDGIATRLQALEADFAALGYPRAASEPPRRWLRRLQQEAGAQLPAEQLQQARTLIDAHYRQRYAAPSTTTPRRRDDHAR